MKKQEVKKIAQTKENESGRSPSLSSSGLLRKTESVRWTVLSRKAMNLDTIEIVPSGDDCGLGGIEGFRGKEALCVTGFRIGGRNDKK